MQISQDDDDHASFTAAASRFGLSGWPLSADVQVMLLLHLLPGLQSLHFILIDHTFWFRNLNDLHSGAQADTAFPIGLQSVRDFHCDFANCVRPRAFAVLLRLPNIRTIAMPICGDIELQLRGFDIVPRGSSSVTRLEFPYARMPHLSLKRILQIPRALTHFSYRALPTTGEGLRLREFAEALAPLKDSLQTLVLDFSRLQLPRTAAGNSEADDGEPAITLHDWPALRHISTSLVPLLGMAVHPDSPGRLAAVLPAGIRTLLTLGDNHWSGTEAAHQLVVLLEQKGAVVVPVLECVGVCENVEVSREAEDRLREACETAGVRMARESLFTGDSRWVSGNADRRIGGGRLMWGTG